MSIILKTRRIVDRSTMSTGPAPSTTDLEATCLVARLEEAEALQGCFSGDGELTWTNPTAVVAAQSAGEGLGWEGDAIVEDGGAVAATAAEGDDLAALAFSDSAFDFKLRLGVAGANVEVAARMPRRYPSKDCSAEAHVNCDTISRAALSRVNEAVTRRLTEAAAVTGGHDNDLCDAMLWLQGDCEELNDAVAAGADTSEAAGTSELDGGSDGAAGAGRADSGARAPRNRTWLWFIGFYTRSIIDAFVEAAGDEGLEGFLMPGKPAVACLEGSAADIASFLVTCRTQLFAKVPAASRKMTVAMEEADIGSGAFAGEGFRELSMAAAAGTHKRKDMTDMAGLATFLEGKGCGHAFTAMFGNAGVERRPAGAGKPDG